MVSFGPHVKIDMYKTKSLAAALVFRAVGCSLTGNRRELFIWEEEASQ